MIAGNQRDKQTMFKLCRVDAQPAVPKQFIRHALGGQFHARGENGSIRDTATPLRPSTVERLVLLAYGMMTQRLSAGTAWIRLGTPEPLL